jgi:hypothetical protein
VVTEGSPPVLRQFWAVAAAVLVLAVYAAVLATMPKEAFWSPDEGAKFIQLHSVEWRHGFQYAIPYGGARIDPDFAFYPTRCRFEDLYPVPLPDGGVKFHWPIWFPFGTGLLVDAFGPTGLYLVPLVSGWLIALLAGHLIRAWDARLTPLAILTVGLATPIAFFSVTFWEHTLATLLGVAALWIVATSRPLRVRTLWVIAPLLLAAAALRIEMLLFAAALVGGWLAAGRWARAGEPTVPIADPASMRRAFIVLGVAAAAALVLLFTALPERHRWIITEVPNFVLGSFAKLPYLIETLTAVLVDAPGNQAPVIPDLWRYAVLLACVAALSAPALRSPRAAAITLLAALVVVLEFSAYLVVLPEAYVSLHGFLPVAPFIVLAGGAFPSVWRARRHAQLAIAVTAAVYACLVCAVIFVFLVKPEGETPVGLEWGSRYLFTLYPIGALLALAGVRELRRTAASAPLRAALTGAAAALLVCGVLLEGRGVWTLVQSRRLVATWQAALRDGPPVVTDVWWLPANMAPLFISHEMHCVRPGELGEWLPLAVRSGVHEFTYANFRGLDTDAIARVGVAVSSEGMREVSGLRLTRIRIAPAAGG